MKKDSKDPHYHFVPTAGHSFPFIRFGLSSRCGEIEDGVSLSHYDTRRRSEGGWVISFADLEAMYLAAKAWRSVRNLETKP